MKPILVFKEIASKLTGFSTPVFGVSWEPPNNERETAQSVVNFLEDRRVLYNPQIYDGPKSLVHPHLSCKGSEVDGTYKTR